MVAKSESIPVIDLSDRDDTEIAKDLTDAFRTIGFATLVNHGVSAETISNGFTASQSFFELPLDTKMQYKYKSHTSNRGYISMGSEKFESLTRPDHKETFDIGKEGEQGYETPWPEELQQSGFKKHMLTYFREFNELNLRLMRLVAIGLGLPDESFLVDRCNEQHCNLRVLHYPELKRENPDETIVRGAIHTDYGSITLLTQDNIGGLRAQKLDGSWINVKPVPDSIIVNVGDMFQYVHVCRQKNCGRIFLTQRTTIDVGRTTVSSQHRIKLSIYPFIRMSSRNVTQSLSFVMSTSRCCSTRLLCCLRMARPPNMNP